MSDSHAAYILTTRGYRSRTKFAVTPGTEDAILQVAAYHRNQSFIWFTPGTHHERRIALAGHRALNEPAMSLGRLQRLPKDILVMIILQLDMWSLVMLRRTNARARQLVTGLFEWQRVVRHAQDALCALVRTELASHVTLMDFHRLLCTRACAICTVRFGNLVHLPSWTRCCSLCAERDEHPLRVVTLASVKRVLHLSRGSLARLPKLITLRGLYDMARSSKYHPGGVALVSGRAALDAYSHENGSEATLLMQLRLCTRSIFKFTTCCLFPSFDPVSGEVEIGISCTGCQLACDKRIISVSSVCLSEVYSRTEFLEHFAWCEQAQNLWEESRFGKSRPSRLMPLLCQLGRIPARESTGR